MPAKKSTNRNSRSSSPYATLISDADQRRINEIHLLQSEGNRLGARLTNVAELQQLEYSGGDPKSHIQQLRRRRREITNQLGTASKDARYFSNLNLVTDRFNSTLLQIRDILWPWSVLNLPIVSDGMSDTPGTPDTDGDIVTTGLFQGAGAFGGMPGNHGSQERWWVRNWNCVAVLPPAPYAGSVSYRFGANFDARVYHVEGIGTLRAFLTIGTTSDVNQPIANWQTVGWPIDVTLPQPAQASFPGGVSVVASIDVNQGRSAAVGIIFGVIVSVIEGYVMFLGNSTFVAGLLGGTDYRSVGKIEYRFNPEWVIGFVREAMAFGG